LKLFLGDKIDPAAEKQKFGYAQQLADEKFKAEVEKTIGASKQFADIAEGDVCRLGVPAKPVERQQPRIVERGEQEEVKKPEEVVEAPPVKPEPKPQPAPVAPIDADKLVEKFAARYAANRYNDEAKQGAELQKALKLAEDDFKNRLKEQERLAEIARMKDDEAKQKKLADELTKLKAAMNKDKQDPKQPQPPQAPVAASPGGGGGGPQPQQGGMDPTQGQDPNAGQQPQPNLLGQMMGMMMGMMNPFGSQQNTQPQPNYNTGSSSRWDEIYRSSASDRGIPPLPSFEQGARAAQQEMLRAIQQGQMGMGGAPNAYGPQPYGPQLPLSQRLGQTSSTRRSAGTASQVNGISGTNQLAVGRTRTKPVELSGGLVF
jgi:hypothetical protein